MLLSIRHYPSSSYANDSLYGLYMHLYNILYIGNECLVLELFKEDIFITSSIHMLTHMDRCSYIHTHTHARTHIHINIMQYILGNPESYG